MITEPTRPNRAGLERVQFEADVNKWIAKLRKPKEMTKKQLEEWKGDLARYVWSEIGLSLEEWGEVYHQILKNDEWLPSIPRVRAIALAAQKRGEDARTSANRRKQTGASLEAIAKAINHAVRLGILPESRRRVVINGVLKYAHEIEENDECPF